MGRKGMKGFIKAAARPSSKPDEDVAEEQPSESTTAALQTTETTSNKASKQAEPAVVSVNKAADAASDEEGEQQGQETRGQMLQRHKRELLAHKKAIQRMGKKSKDEIAKLDAEIEARHASELQQLESAPAAAPSSSSSTEQPAAAAAAAQKASAADGSAAAANRASKYLVDLSIGGDDGEQNEQGAGKKQTKAQKRREKQAAKQAERDARIAAELEAAGPSEREEEEKALKALLAPLGLGVKEIRADGHCLYRSLEDQLEVTAAAAAAAADGDSSSSSQVLNYQELRELAAEHIRQNKDQFAPFLLPEDESEDPDEHYEKYCFTLETTAAWGGHLELTALAAALKRQIKVHAVGMQTVTLGDDYAGDGRPPALELCYLRHAFGLGEHYNSTKKVRFVRFSLANEEDKAEAAADEQQQVEEEDEEEEEKAEEEQDSEEQ